MIVTAEMLRADSTINKDLWETPPHIFDALNRKFNFTLDPCCTIHTAKCKFFFTPKEDGLKQDWGNHVVFVNPPYSRNNIDLWVKKCYDECEVSTILALLPASTSANWFQKYVLGNTLYWVDKRIKFVGAKYTAPFSSVIVHFNRVNQNLTFKQ